MDQQVSQANPERRGGNTTARTDPAKVCDIGCIHRKGHIASDHVHLLVSMPPNLAVSELVQRVKGRSSRMLLDEFTELKRQYWGGHLWARGYFAASSGNVTDEIIRQYIESQGENFPPPEGGNFSIGD